MAAFCLAHFKWRRNDRKILLSQEFTAGSVVFFLCALLVLEVDSRSLKTVLQKYHFNSAWKTWVFFLLDLESRGYVQIEISHMSLAFLPLHIIEFNFFSSYLDNSVCILNEFVFILLLLTLKLWIPNLFLHFHVLFSTVYLFSIVLQLSPFFFLLSAVILPLELQMDLSSEYGILIFISGFLLYLQHFHVVILIGKAT